MARSNLQQAQHNEDFMTRPFSHLTYADEAEVVKNLLNALDWDDARGKRILQSSIDMVHRIRALKSPAGQIETFLRQYSLTSKEGLALMALAEALLRIPDKETANALIRDKVVATDWLAAMGGSKDWMTRIAGFGLLATQKTLDSVLSKVGEPVIREAMAKAMQMMGGQFVLGQDIRDAMKNAKAYHKAGCRVSYDVLGEGARTREDSEKFYASYEAAIRSIAEGAETKGKNRPGISVKISALHPRYSFTQQDLCVPELADKLAALARIAADADLTFTIDAEEVNRLEISFDIIESILKNGNLPKGWDGFGLALQAYQKRALPAVDWLHDLAAQHGRQMQVRLVKGAYWDTEVKRAQVMGLPDYPVFTRKSSTDVSYLACAQKLMAKQDLIFPMFGTHNAHTVMAVMDMAKTAGNRFEFQRLHGMGDGLYKALLAQHDVGVCVYAPVGEHAELLPYLVRRLLENGANTSFVNRLLDPNEPVEDIVTDPVEKTRNLEQIRHPGIAMPVDLYRNEAPHGRANSEGFDMDDSAIAAKLEALPARYAAPYESAPLIAGQAIRTGAKRDVVSPFDTSRLVGHVYDADETVVAQAFAKAKPGFAAWNRTDANERAAALDRAADLFEEHGSELMALCQSEAGKTFPDALAEVREAVDFLRYYANKGREDFAAHGFALPGPTGEKNTLTLHGRGVFVCISPWNFPLAIFTGQVSAALMAGNAVIAKPAEQTSLIGMKAVQLLHKAGVPVDALHFIPGGGKSGSALTAHPDVAGIAFTGSTGVARIINRVLAAKDGPIVPLIAETGGQNAMIVDSTALPEQVVDSAILSAFGSAGQRCSALRILCLQDDIADKIIAMLKGAMKELRVGLPGKLSTDVGPVIDAKALAGLRAHRDALQGFGKLIYECSLEPGTERGHYLAPSAWEIDSVERLKEEVFGPILHVVRYKREKLNDLVESLNATGFGLTFGVQSRIETFQNDMCAAMNVGNAYVNRSMIGAVVGVQPFGGQNLSGTGPKAGGPFYMHRFATEKVVSIDTTSAGGNASLVSLVD